MSISTIPISNRLLNRTLYNTKSDSKTVNNKTKKSAYSSSSSKTTSEIEMKAIGEVAAAEKEEKKKAEVNSVYTHSANLCIWLT